MSRSATALIGDPSDSQPGGLGAHGGVHRSPGRGVPRHHRPGHRVPGRDGDHRLPGQVPARAGGVLTVGDGGPRGGECSCCTRPRTPGSAATARSRASPPPRCPAPVRFGSSPIPEVPFHPCLTPSSWALDSPASGAAIQLKRSGIEDFVILDREDDLGGTWYAEPLSGACRRCPHHHLFHFFEPNPNWSRLFSTGDEIKQYADEVADKYDVRRHIRFSTVVDGARWDEETNLWRVSLANDEVLSTRYLITATGFLSQPKIPDIPGIENFDGRVIHTTEWRGRLRPRRETDRGHRHRRHRGATHPRSFGQVGGGAHRVPAHPDLGGAQDRPALRTAGQETVRPCPRHQRVLRWFTRLGLRGHGVDRRGALRRRFAAAATSRPPICPSCTGSSPSATRTCGAGSRRTTTSAASGPHSATGTTGRSPATTSICRTPVSTTCSPTASSARMAPKSRSTPWCWPPVSTCGRPTSPPSR